MQTNRRSKLLGQQIFLIHGIINRCGIHRHRRPRALSLERVADELADSLSVIGEQSLSFVSPIYASAAPTAATVKGLLREVIKVLRQGLHKVRKLGRTRWRVLNTLQHHVQLPIPHPFQSSILCSLRRVRRPLAVQVLPIHTAMMNAGLKAYRNHGWLMISSTPFRPMRWSAEVTSLIITELFQTHLLMKSMHSGEQPLFSTSRRLKYTFQFNT